MNVSRIIPVRNGDALVALREFLAAWWVQYQLDAFLAPVELADQSGVAAQAIEDPAGLAAVNPFAPVMLNNAASAVGQFVQDYSGARLAVMTRPCELRALVELRKRRRSPGDPQPAVILGVDCLGTLPPAEYVRSAQTRGAGAVIGEALNYAAEGGLTPQRLRTACQVCDWPAPRGADVTIGAIGVVPHQYLLLIARDETTDAYLGLDAVASQRATEAQLVRREIALGTVADKRARARKTRVEELRSNQQFGDIGSVLSWFTHCSLCGDCLDACPLYNGELTGLLGVRGAHFGGRAPLAELVDVSRWLASCAGCGMCEEACDSRVPLMQFVTALSHRIRDELHYTPGDPAQRLPWASG